MAENSKTHDRRAILVVDDDIAIVILLKLALCASGYQVTTATNRTAALQAWREERSPVVLLDLGLPPHPHTPDEGLALLATLRDIDPTVKVIVLTGQEEREAAFRAVRAGAFDFLTKPVDEPTLQHAVHRAFLFWQQEKRMRDAAQLRLTLTVATDHGLKAVRQEVEEVVLRQVLQETDHNVTKTARILGLQRENVYYLLRKYGITRDNP